MKGGVTVEDVKYGIEIKVSGEWKAVNPPAGPPPYSFETVEEAAAMARVLYPALIGKPELLRIRPAVSASCSPEVADFVDPSGALRKKGLLTVKGGNS